MLTGNRPPKSLPQVGKKWKVSKVDENYTPQSSLVVVLTVDHDLI